MCPIGRPKPFLRPRLGSDTARSPTRSAPQPWSGAHARNRRAPSGFSPRIDSCRCARSGDPSHSFGRGLVRTRRVRRHAQPRNRGQARTPGIGARPRVSRRESIVADVPDRATQAIPSAEAWFGHGAFADMQSHKKTKPRISGAHVKRTRACWGYRYFLK